MSPTGPQTILGLCSAIAEFKVWVSPHNDPLSPRSWSTNAHKCDFSTFYLLLKPCVIRAYRRMSVTKHQGLFSTIFMLLCFKLFLDSVSLSVSLCLTISPLSLSLHDFYRYLNFKEINTYAATVVLHKFHSILCYFCFGQINTQARNEYLATQCSI